MQLVSNAVLDIFAMGNEKEISKHWIRRSSFIAEQANDRNGSCKILMFRKRQPHAYVFLASISRGAEGLISNQQQFALFDHKLLI